MIRYACLLSLALVFTAPSFPQTDPAVGIYPHSTQVTGIYDSVDLATSNINIQIPIRTKPGKIPFTYSLVGNIHASELGGWRIFPFPHLSGNIVSVNTASATPQTTKPNPVHCHGINGDTLYTHWAVIDSTGATHPINSAITTDSFGCYSLPTPKVVLDGSGFTIVWHTYNTTTVYDRSGNAVTLFGASTVTDPDGASMSTSTDTLGVTPISFVNNSIQYTDAAGNPQTYTVNSSGFTQLTNFGCGVEMPATNVSLPTSISTPIGNYVFSYEVPPGYSGNGQYGPYVTGRITMIQSPDGASVKYSYSGGNNGINCNSDVVPTLTRTVTDNAGNASTWTYVNSNNGFGPTNFTVTATDPLNNQTVYNFDGEYQTQERVYQGGCPTGFAGCTGGGTLLRTRTTCYNNNFSNCATAINITPPTQVDTYTSFNTSSSSSLVEAKFDVYGNTIEVKKYDSGAAMPPTGNPVSDTVISYGQSWNGTGCTAYPSGVYIDNTPCYSHTMNSSGTDVAKTQITYSNTGHPTSVSKWISASNWANTSYAYGTNGAASGVLSSVTDANNATTTFGNFTCNSILPQTTTLPQISGESFQMTTSQTWDCNGGVVTSAKDANSQTTSYSYINPASGLGDPFWRLTRTTYPDTGQLTTTYNDTASPPNSVSTRLIGSSLGSLVVQTNYDGIGHTPESILTSDPDGATYSVTTYDALGRKSQVYNPTRCSPPTSNCGEPTWGFTSYTYDVLNRITQVTNPDSSTVLTTYSGRATQVQDEGNGGQRVTHVSQVDGLGRLVSVCEVSSASQLGSTGTPAACGQDIGATGFLTTYGYDALGNLTSVSQSGLNGRTFQYDGLSRLISATNPESGTASYTYDNNGNVLTKTDARSIKTTYTYDALNRLTGKSYSDGTPAATFNYDQTSALGVTLTNTLGRKSLESTGGSLQTGSVFSYDQMGRLANNSQCTPQNCGTSVFTIQYPQYDFLGDLLAGTNAAGVTFTYTYNAAARLTGISSNFVDPSHPGTLLSSAHYTPFGAPASSTFGNGIGESFGYDKRLRQQSYTATSGGTTQYSFNISSFAPNGNILSANDSVNGTWTYSYDEMNRLCNANQSSTQPVCHQSALYTYDYDRFGNRWHQNGPQSSQLGFDSNNHIIGVTGVGYDASGDLTSDGAGIGSHRYFYDAENRIIQVDGTLGSCSTATACYVYDAEGRRVRKTTPAGTLDFLYDTAGRKVAEIDTTATFQRGELYAGNRHIAVYTPDPGPTGATFFIHADWLGTERVRTNMTSVACETITSLPFGDGQTITDSCGDSAGDVSPTHFTGKERDSESGNDYFGARHYSNLLGRFLQPDPSPMGIAAGDPQSWNLYSYVRNRPTRSADIGGNWATDIHVEIATFALQGYLSAGELQEIANRQYVMDSDQSDQNKHFMANPSQSPQDAANDAWKFVANEMQIASFNVGANGQLNKTALDALGDAIHTVQDFTSPMHTDSNFMPMVWEGGYWPPSKWGPGIAHVLGENSPERGWSRIGYAIRLNMAAYLQSGAACEPGKRCLTQANFESEVRRNIEDYVRWHYYSDANHYHNGLAAIEEDAARQCALGNPAACQ